jgi:hypothetical protein
VLVSHTSAFDGGDTKSDNFKIADFITCTVDCITSSSEFTVLKFYDANLDGIQDNAEPTITGWNVDLTLGAARDTVLTTFSISIADGTAFTAAELLPSTGTWIPTVPPTGSQSGTTSGQTITFGNVCLAGGGGLTLGYWSNKNGQAAMGTTTGGIGATLTFLNGLPLANAIGNQPDFTSYAGFRTWILNATATNMAYMLSAQLAAMELNVRNAGLNGNSLVYAPAVTGSTGAGGFITINALMADAVTALSDQLTLSGDPNRVMQEAIKTALDSANNNLNFLSATPCSIVGATWTGIPTL